MWDMDDTGAFPAEQLIAGVREHAIFGVDRGGVIVTWTPGAENVTGWAAAEIVGRPCTVLCHPDEAHLAVAELKHAREEGHFRDERLLTRRDGSTFWASISISSLAEPGDGYVVVLRDDTDRHRDEDERRRLADFELKEQITADLHADVIQSVFRVGMGINAAMALVTDEEARDRLHRAVRELDDLITHVRTTLWNAGSRPDADEAADIGVDPDAVPQASHTNSDLHILVVDDEPDMRLLLTELLADLGSVHAVPDSYQALAWLDEERVDVMVLDLMMPGASGVDLLERLRTFDRAVPTVVVSGMGADDGLAKLARAAGAEIVLSKPFDQALLRAKVLEAGAAAPN